MPAESFEPIPEGVTNVAKYISQQWQDPGFQAKRERVYKEGTDATTHASKWLDGTQHLHDPDLVAKGQKIIKQGSRGILSADDVNTQMDHIFGALYPSFDPAATPFTVPPHLGDQFK